MVAGSDRLKIHKALDQPLERIDVERVHAAGREETAHGIEPALHRHARRRKLIHDVTRHHRKAAIDAGRAPELSKPLARLFRPAAHQAVGQHHRIHRARRGAGHAVYAEPAVFQQLIEHAPGEGAMRAAALESQVDAFLRTIRLRLLAAEPPGEEFVHVITVRSSRRRSEYWRR